MTDSMTADASAQPASIWAVTFKYSLILGLAYGAYSILLYATGLAANSSTGLLSVVLFIVLLVLALRSFRTGNAGYMSFGQGFLIVFLVSVLSNIVNSVISYIYLAFINGSALELLTEQAIDSMSANPGMNSETLEMMAGIFEKIYTPGGLLVMGICAGVFLGFFAAIILSLIMKNKPPIE